MRLGLIARAEVARGLAIQSKGFFDHMPVERVLLVKMAHPDCEVDPSWYPGAWPIEYDDLNHTLNENLVRQFLDGLDVVFTVETPYDWHLPRWAREMGVKTVIQGNPEFYRHDLPTHSWQEHPTEWWWPTSWRTQHLPAGRLMPVPMPTRPNIAGDPLENRPLRLLHVQGKKAWLDRNGSQVFADALRACHTDVEATIYGLQGEAPTTELRPNVKLNVYPDGVRDRWEMYAGHDVLVMPRRYGGLCLPALEAAACGLAVAMPDFSPNHELASLFFDARGRLEFPLSCGPVLTADTNHMDLGAFIDGLSHDRRRVADAQVNSQLHLATWDRWRDEYLRAFEELP